jgi:hypothetical protein
MPRAAIAAAAEQRLGLMGNRPFLIGAGFDASEQMQSFVQRQ